MHAAGGVDGMMQKKPLQLNELQGAAPPPLTL
jgi:hypothetical protein